MRGFIVGFLATTGAIALTTIGACVGVAYWLIYENDNVALPDKFVLEVDLRQDLPLAQIAGPFSLINPAPLSLDGLVLKLKAAESDPRVQGLLIRLGETSHGFAKAQELRQAIERFSDSGRSTAVWADSFGELTPGNEGYYIASAADRIEMQPGGYLGLTGLAFEYPFFKRLLASLGIEAAVFRRAEYKTALDSFDHEGLSKANLEMTNSIADELFLQLTSDIAVSRELDLEDVLNAVEQSPIAAVLAVEYRLVDGLSYWPVFRSEFLAEAGNTAETVALGSYDRQFGSSAPDHAKKIGLLSLSGNVVRGDGQIGQTIAADTLSSTFEELRQSDIEALILRIDTGGGSAVASETIAFEIRQFAATGKPVIVSMVNATASGGYWIAVEANRILAMPGTFTGSIGVIAGKPVIDGFLDGIGVDVEGVSRGRFAELWSIAKSPSTIEAEKIDQAIEEVYDRFKAHVVAKRDSVSIDDAAKGRVWLGTQALQNGLADKLGGLDEAITEAKIALNQSADQSIALQRFPQEKDWNDIMDDLLAMPFDLISTRIRSTVLYDPGAAMLRANLPEMSP